MFPMPLRRAVFPLVSTCLICAVGGCSDPTSSETEEQTAATPDNIPPPMATPTPTPSAPDPIPETMETQRDAAAAGSESLSGMLAEAAADPALAGARNQLIARARETLARPVTVRYDSLADLKTSGIRMKYPERPAHRSQLDEETWEITALSDSDSEANFGISTNLPRLAAAAVLTGDATFRDYAIDQLREMTRWAPFHRPGWSLRDGGTLRLPEGGDGAWLGTGWAIRGITETVELIPDIPDDLREALNERLAEEVEGIVDDWKTKRPWYVRGDAVYSNQWVIPTEGLIRACLFLGVEDHRDAYELGVHNMLRSLDAMGQQGEFLEGLSYSALTMISIVSAGRAMERHGDRRVLDHPFFQNFPQWFAHHVQPGGALINAFNMGKPEIRDADFQQLAALFAISSGSPIAVWLLENQTGYPNTLEGLAARTVDVTPEPPPLYASYEKATRLNWRSSWDDDTATGLWIRGGHVTDRHDHMDRGHVNFIIGRQPVLIEAGKPNYGNPQFDSHFKGVAGHNVLQIGDAPADEHTPAELKNRAGQILSGDHRKAPLTVERLDEEGGVARVNASASYALAEKWIRDVAWNAQSVEIDDSVVLTREEPVTFRWHLGEPSDAEVETGDGWIRVGAILLRYESNYPVELTVEPMLSTTGHNRPINNHACVVVRTTQPVAEFEMKTSVSLAADQDGTP